MQKTKPEKIELIRQLYNQGLSQKQIATLFDRSQATIQELMKNNNIKTRPLANNPYRKRLFNEKNVNWKGDNASYQALHIWIRNHKPKPNYCEKCKIKKSTDVANISGQYKRDINDFLWLCELCHLEFDGALTRKRNKDGTFKKGFVVENGNFDLFKLKVLECWNGGRNEIV